MKEILIFVAGLILLIFSLTWFVLNSFYTMGCSIEIIDQTPSIPFFIVALAYLLGLISVIAVWLPAPKKENESDPRG